MLFRSRGNNIQVVRIEVGQDGKRKSIGLGTFRKDNQSLPEELRSKLTHSELDEVAQWMHFSRESTLAKQHAAALNLPEQIMLTCEWLNSVDRSQAKYAVDAILEAIRELRKSLGEKV